jgi:hypothetical protein
MARPCTHKRTMSAVGITSEADPFTAYGGSADGATNTIVLGEPSNGQPFDRLSLVRRGLPSSAAMNAVDVTVGHLVVYHPRVVQYRAIATRLFKNRE